MSEPVSPVAFEQINIVVRDMRRSVAFYRLLGVSIDDAPPEWAEWAPHHANGRTSNGVRVEFDSVAFAKQWNPGLDEAKLGSAVISFFHVSSREDVDRIYALEIVRDDGRRERVECETRSYLQHDLLHYAAESEAALNGGFWGNLAKGKTLAQMNDRTGMGTADGMPELPIIEKIVGVLSGAMKGLSPEQSVSGFQEYASSLGEAVPRWFTTEFVARVQERMRRLMGRWKATPFGRAMELEWPPGS